MGFTGKNVKKTDSGARTTVVAAGTDLTGDIELKDNLHLDGKMQGNINARGDVTIGQTGRFKGDIKAKRVLVSGHMDGKVDADRLEIVATGQVSGDIKVRELVIEPGGQFVGSSHVKKHDTPRLVQDNSAAESGDEPNRDPHDTPRSPVSGPVE